MRACAEATLIFTCHELLWKCRNAKTHAHANAHLFGGVLLCGGHTNARTHAHEQSCCAGRWRQPAGVLVLDLGEKENWRDDKGCFLQTEAVLFCCFCFFFPVQQILIHTYQLQIHLYNLKELLVPVNPPTMPRIFSRVSVPPWRRRFVTASLPPLPPATLQCGCGEAAGGVGGGKPEMFTAIRAHDSHSAGKMRPPRTRRPRVELAPGQKSVFRDDFPGARTASRRKMLRLHFPFLLPVRRRKGILSRILN